MSCPRLEVDLTAIGSNTATLVERLLTRGISVTAITKAVLAAPEVATVMLEAGASGLGDSRVANLQRLRDGFGGAVSLTLIRSPMLTDAEAVVRLADVSMNTEPTVLAALSRAAVARGVTHGVVLMVELGDLREGIMPARLEAVAQGLARLPNLRLHGVGANLACRSGVVPDAVNMAALDSAVAQAETITGERVPLVSGGNSTALGWACSGGPVGRVNDLRVGEAILLGRDPLDRSPIVGLDTGAFRLIAEVIESSRKPAKAWGTLARSAFSSSSPAGSAGAADVGATPGEADAPAPSVRTHTPHHHGAHQAILAIGRQDVDPDGLTAPEGVQIVGSSSDHLVVRTESALRVGQELAFTLDYSALLRAMTSPFVDVVYRGR